jgi:hypothetical protein
MKIIMNGIKFWRVNHEAISPESQNYLTEDTVAGRHATIMRMETAI